MQFDRYLIERFEVDPDEMFTFPFGEVVYLARDRWNQRRQVLVHEEKVEKVTLLGKRDPSTLLAYAHPNLVQLLEVVVTPTGYRLLIAEYRPGTAIRPLYRICRILPSLAQRIVWTLELCDLVGLLDREGILHECELLSPHQCVIDLAKRLTFFPWGFHAMYDQDLPPEWGHPESHWGIMLGMTAAFILGGSPDGVRQLPLPQELLLLLKSLLGGKLGMDRGVAELSQILRQIEIPDIIPSS